MGKVSDGVRVLSKLRFAEYAELITLYFIQGAALGMWFVPLSNVLEAHGFHVIRPFAFAASAMAAFISPLIFGAMADRHASPVKVLRGLALATALAMTLVCTGIKFHFNPWLVLALIQVQSLCSAPTWSISSAIIFARLADAQKEFGPIRAMGTLGWMVGCWLVSLIGADSSPLAGFTAALAWAGVGGFTFFLGNRNELVERSSSPQPSPPAKGGIEQPHGEVHASVPSSAAIFCGDEEQAKMESGVVGGSGPGVSPARIEMGARTETHGRDARATTASFLSTKFFHSKWSERFGLDALTLLRNRDHRVVFVILVLFSIPAASFYPFAPPHLRELGFTHASAWMSLGQVTEMIAMFSLGALWLRWRLKWIFAVGLGFGVLRFACSAMDTKAWLLLGVTLHGASYTLVFITAQIYLDQRVDAAWRARAQALMSLMSGGVGNLLGYLGTGWWFSVCAGFSGKWMIFWGGLSASVVAILIYFLAAYRGKAGKKTADERG